MYQHKNTNKNPKQKNTFSKIKITNDARISQINYNDELIWQKRYVSININFLL